MSSNWLECVKLIERCRKDCKHNDKRQCIESRGGGNLFSKVLLSTFINDLRKDVNSTFIKCIEEAK